MLSSAEKESSVYSLNRGHLEEWFQVLVRSNSERIVKASAMPKPEGHFSTGNFLEFLSFTCQSHGLPKQVCYLAAEIFESFMQTHVTEMHHLVCSQVAEQADQKLEWNKVLERIKGQAMLRILSCLQVASKHQSHYKHITCQEVMSQLRKVGHKYSEESIRKSEMRVLKTIGFKVDSCTPLIYLDILIAKLVQEHLEDESADKGSHLPASPSCKCPFKMTSPGMYRGMGLKLLDVVLMDRQNIYKNFAQVITSSQASSQDDRRLIFAIQSDHILMAASVLVASSFLADQSQTDQLIEALEGMLLIDSTELVDMAISIIKSSALI